MMTFEVHASLAGIEKLAGLRDDLAHAGFGDAVLEKLFWENAARFFSVLS